MKQFVLMVALSATGETYDHAPAVLVDENSCMMLAELINSQNGVFQHAYCTEYTLAPFVSPRPKRKP